jgi:hypothetical protein
VHNRPNKINPHQNTKKRGEEAASKNMPDEWRMAHGAWRTLEIGFFFVSRCASGYAL